NGKHPRDSSPHALLWTRDADFYKSYHGKPCVFGHTPTPFLPLRGRLGRHGIYLFNSAIGIDTGYNLHSPLSCLSLPDFTLYQAFADGRTATHHITTLIPETLKEMKRKAAGKRAGSNSQSRILHLSFSIFHLTLIDTARRIAVECPNEKWKKTDSDFKCRFENWFLL